MGGEFTPIFLYVILAAGIAAGMILGSALLAPKKKTRVKDMPYESGMDPVGDARQRFDVRFYLVAIVFLLFDVELLFLYPWAVGQWSETVAGSPAGIPGSFHALVFGEVTVFLVMLGAAFAYAWKKGVFEWR